MHSALAAVIAAGSKTATIPPGNLIEFFDPRTLAVGAATSYASSVSASVLDTSSVEPWAPTVPVDKRPIVTDAALGTGRALVYSSDVLRGAITPVSAATTPITIYMLATFDAISVDQWERVFCIQDPTEVEAWKVTLELSMYWQTELDGTFTFVDGEYPRAILVYMSGSQALGQTDWVYGSDELTTGVPHVVALTLDGTSIEIYIDGVAGTLRIENLLNVYPGTPMPAPLTSADWGGSVLELGAFTSVTSGERAWWENQYNSPFDGTMGPWLLYSVAHDAAQVAAVTATLFGLWGV